MDFTEIFKGESLTLDQFNERISSMKLADLSTGDYVAKGKYDADVKKAKDELKTAKETIATLEENKGDTEALQAELDKYKAEEQKRQQEAAEAAEHAALIERFGKVKGDREFSSQFAENGLLDAFNKAISDPENTGKGDKELFDALTKDATGLFKNPQQEPVKVPGVTGSWADADNNERMMRKVMGLPITKGE